MNNKKWFTLIELILVVWIIFFILYSLSNFPLQWTLKIVEAQNIKDWIVNVNNEVRNYSYNNTTVWQDVINDFNWKTNTQTSRFDGPIRVWNNSTTRLAYYHAIYFTTKESDLVDSTVNDFSNANLYILQYRQEGYTDVKKRIVEPFKIDYNWNDQVLKGNSDTTYWSKKIRVPTFRSYYLNKIVNFWDSCSTWTNQFDNGYILYSTNSLNYNFYKWTTLDLTFDYKFCFSQFSGTYDDPTWISIRVNRDRLWEYFFETLENY